MKVILLSIIVSLGSMTEAETNITLKTFNPPPVDLSCIRPCPLPPTSSICAGPISGCGLLKDFGDDCLLSNYNCLNNDAVYKFEYPGLCYPKP